MRNLFLSLAVTAAALGSAFVSAPVQAQATRTWVSGVGDDVNPCSRTAPCKTFAGAISKTAAGGEINCLDPGGFGAVTIIKSMTIDCEHTEGGALAGGNGIVINALATDTVRLRGLDIFGVNPPSNGVRIIQGGTVILDKVRIARFNAANSWGVSFQPSATTELFIVDSVIFDNGNVGGTGGGVLIQPTGANGQGRVVIRDTQIVNNTQGLRADTTGNTNSLPIKLSVENSSASHNAQDGFLVNVAPGTFGVDMMISGSSANFNGGSGYETNGLGAAIRLGRSSATGNAIGTNPLSSGVIQSYGTNQIRGNTSDGTRTVITQE